MTYSKDSTNTVTIMAEYVRNSINIVIISIDPKYKWPFCIDWMILRGAITPFGIKAPCGKIPIHPNYSTLHRLIHVFVSGHRYL